MSFSLTAFTLAFLHFDGKPHEVIFAFGHWNEEEMRERCTSDEPNAVEAFHFDAHEKGKLPPQWAIPLQLIMKSRGTKSHVEQLLSTLFTKIIRSTPAWFGRNRRAA